MKLVYTKEIIITEKHLDYNNHVNNVQYVHWVEEMAEEHWNLVKHLTPYKDDFWVMYDHHIHYRKQVFLGDSLLIKTFPLPPEGLKQPRKVEFYCNGELMVDSKTLWIMCDHETKKVKKLSENWLNELEAKL